jgi:hypothetical protein
MITVILAYGDERNHLNNNPASTKKGRTMNPLTQFKRIRNLPLLLALAFAAPTVARADAVTDWNLIASNAIVVTAGQQHPFSVLSFAMVQGAVYDAVNAIDRGHHPYLSQPPSNPTDSKGGGRGDGLLPGSDRTFPGAAVDPGADLQQLYGGPPRRPTGIEGCGARYR